METPNEALSAEHEAIEALLVALDRMAARLREGREVPKDDLYDAMTVIVEFADKCHHAKEESVLFPALSAASPQVGAELAGRLTNDHRALRKLVGTIRELMPKATTKVIRKQIGKHLVTYTRVLREHVRIENELLLPEVARALSPQEQARIGRAFERVEREDVGLGMHEAYRSIIRRLAETYGSLTPTPPHG